MTETNKTFIGKPEKKLEIRGIELNKCTLRYCDISGCGLIECDAKYCRIVDSPIDHGSYELCNLIGCELTAGVSAKLLECHGMEIEMIWRKTVVFTDCLLCGSRISVVTYEDDPDIPYDKVITIDGTSISPRLFCYNLEGAKIVYLGYIIMAKSYDEYKEIKEEIDADKIDPSKGKIKIFSCPYRRGWVRFFNERSRRIWERERSSNYGRLRGDVVERPETRTDRGNPRGWVVWMYDEDFYYS